MRTPMIASIVGLAVLIASPAAAQRLDDRQIAISPGSTVTTYGSQSYGAGQTGGPGVQWRTGGQVGGQWHGQTGTPPVIQQTPLPPSNVPGSGPGGVQTPPMAGNGQRQQWGGRIGGHWSGGMRAPGGWNAYHRPSRGFTLPGYWVAPSFFIGDFVSYGLSTPPYGYHWSRYYDDAVLVDDDGRVWDSVRGIDWRDEDYGYDQRRYDQRGYDQQRYETRGDRYDRRDGPGGYYQPPPPPPPSGPIIERRAGVPGYTQTYSAGGYYAGGYWYPPVTTTTITVETAPVITTTTTTEYIETTGYRAKRKVYRRPARRVIHRRVCDCGCGCR